MFEAETQVQSRPRAERVFCFYEVPCNLILCMSSQVQLISVVLLPLSMIPVEILRFQNLRIPDFQHPNFNSILLFPFSVLRNGQCDRKETMTGAVLRQLTNPADGQHSHFISFLFSLLHVQIRWVGGQRRKPFFYLIPTFFFAIDIPTRSRIDEMMVMADEEAASRKLLGVHGNCLAHFLLSSLNNSHIIRRDNLLFLGECLICNQITLLSSCTWSCHQPFHPLPSQLMHSPLGAGRLFWMIPCLLLLLNKTREEFSINQHFTFFSDQRSHSNSLQ